MTVASSATPSTRTSARCRSYEGKRDAGMTLFVGSNSGYGGYVEIGTEKMVARPTLVPALVENKRRAARLIEAGARRHAGQ
jgi:hypothetical protein